MTVLIATANQDIVRGYYKNVVFTESTKHTCTFKVTKAKFQKMLDAGIADGFNIFALFSW